jgi:hypothetical protein
MMFKIEVITIGGGLRDFLGASCSGSAFSAPVVSVSMSVLRFAKKLRVGTAFGGSLAAEDVGTDLVDFLAGCEVSLELCSLRFFSSRSHPGPLIPMRFCSLHHCVLPMHSLPSV